MSCLTNGSLFLTLGNDGDVCSGHGACVEGLCVCSPLWTGRADFITLEGLACQNPVVLDKFVWALVLFVWVRLQVQALVALWRNPHLRKSVNALSIQAFLAIPVMLASLLTRVITDENLGVSLPVTIVFCIGYILNTLTAGYILYFAFATLFKGSNDFEHHLSVNRLIRRAYIFGIVVNLINIAVYTYTMVAATFLPPGATPERIAYCLARNACTVFYFGSYLLLHRAQLHNMHAITKSLSQQDSPAATFIRNKLVVFEDTTKASVKAVIFVAFLYGLFAIVPQLYIWTYLPTALLTVVAATGSHPMNMVMNNSTPSTGTSSGSKSKQSRAVAIAREHSQQSRIVISSAAAGSVMVRRAGQDAFSRVEDATMIEDELNHGDVVQDNGVQVNLITRHTLTEDPRNTLATVLFGSPRLTNLLLWASSRAMERHSTVVHAGVIIAGLFSAALVFLTLNETYVPDIVGLVLVGFSVFYFLAFATLINLGVAKRLLSSSIFWIRITSAMISFLALSLSLNDVRAVVAVYIFVLQVFCALGDAMTGEMQHFRVVSLFHLAVVLVVVLVLSYFRLMSTTFFTLVVSPTFDYDFLQLARDLYLGSLIVSVFDVAFALRAAGKRFATITRPLKFVLIKFGDDDDDDAPEKQLRPNFMANQRNHASQLEMKSGFLVKGMSASGDDSANPGHNVKIYVDMVSLAQADMLAVHCFGRERGHRMFDLLLGTKGRLLWTLLILPVAVLLFGAPFMISDTRWYLCCVPFAVYHLWREMATNSLVMLRLLIKKRSLQVQLAFLSIWFALYCVSFPNFAILLAICMTVISITELFKDASVRNPLRLSRVKNKLLIGVSFLVIAAELVWASFPYDNRSYVDFRPDLISENTTIVYSDRSNVVDLSQQLVDLSLTLGLGHLVLAYWVFFHVPMDELQMLRIPIAAEWKEVSF